MEEAVGAIPPAAPSEENFLLTLPEEVFNEHMFSYLKTNDLLRLRRTCQQLKLYSEDYMSAHPRSHVREINETDHTLEDYIRVDLPSSYIYINNRGPQFYENSHIPEFLQLYASKITHLRVKQFSACGTKAEHEFFLALTNLQHLNIESVDAQHKAQPRSGGSSSGMPEGSCYFPPTFRNLRHLALNQVQIFSQYDCEYAWDFLHFCPDLEYFRYPYFSGDVTNTVLIYHMLVNGLLKAAVYVVQRRELAKIHEKPNLKFYDFRHHRRNGLIPEDKYVQFVEICGFNNVKLLNVNAEQHSSVESIIQPKGPLGTCVYQPYLPILTSSPFPNPDRFYRNSGMYIASLENISASLVTELYHLEKLVITNTSQCSFRRLRNGQLPYLDFDWPNLQFLDITIDSTHLGRNLAGEQHPTSHLEAFLFSSVPRPSLQELKVRYKERTENEPPLRCLRVGNLVHNCANLTKITLSNWLGTNKSLVTLWAGLTQLEEVTLKNCVNLGNVAFVGENIEDPVFLKLPKLRKLALIGLDKLPKITDRIFALVFCHLHLKEFYLKSTAPIKSVTIAGIQALLMGEFRDSIEKFPFHEWSLDNVSPEELYQLQKQFRSEYML